MTREYVKVTDFMECHYLEALQKGEIKAYTSNNWSISDIEPIEQGYLVNAKPLHGSLQRLFFERNFLIGVEPSRKFNKREIAIQFCVNDFHKDDGDILATLGDMYSLEGEQAEETLAEIYLIMDKAIDFIRGLKDETFDG